MDQTNRSSQLLEYKQLVTQSNIVYLSTWIASMIFEVVFFLLKADLALWVNTFVLVLGYLPIYLNKKGYYALASLIYLGMMSMSASVNAIVFGLDAGFGFYFFNYAGLIIYTSWKAYQKLIALIFDGLLLYGLYFYFTMNEPIISLSIPVFYSFLVLNIALNITGIAHSAYFYMNNAMQATRRLSYLSTTDLLTGLMNRSAFIEEFIDFCQMKKSGIGFIMFDIDYFKSVNDTHGHLCGDAVLSRLGLLLKENIQSDVLVGRYGGEEFVLGFNANSVKEVEVLAEKIRNLVEIMKVEYDHKLIQSTISVGAVYYPLDLNHEVNIDQIFAQADQLLYISKQKGRNRITVEMFKSDQSDHF